MGKLPVFAGRTQVVVMRPAEPPGVTTVTFADGGTQSRPTGAKPGWYRAVYTRISDDQLNQVREFFETHQSPERWQCEGIMEPCYFSAAQAFPPAIKQTSEGYILELVFQVMPRKP